MKRILSFVYILIIGSIAFGQTPSDKYQSLLKKADTYYRVKNYKTAAATYTQAFKLNHWKASSDERYNAACAFALAGIPDSTFYHLIFIVRFNGYSKYEQIANDADLRSIQKDKRWKPLLDMVKLNIKNKEAKLNKVLIRELDSIYKEDQQSRNRMNDIVQNYGYQSNEFHELAETMHKKDSTNLISIKKIIDHYGWLGEDVIGEEGNSTLFLVIQHSDQKTQEKYLPVMREAVKKGNAKASALALLEDRVALGQGKKQIYGSQIILDPKTGKDTLAPIEDFVNVDKRREAVGLEPLEEYVKYWGIVLKKKEKVKPTTFNYTNSDFATATEIHDSIVGPTNVADGFGSQRDFKISRGYQESNSAWFKFTINRDTVLTFDIVPTNSKDDYDFILFKCSNPDCITKIQSNEIKPDRWCFSINYDKNGSTGLSENAPTAYLGAGPGFGYVSGLPVKAGDTYYLMVDFAENYHHTPDGFTVYFYNYWPNKPKGLLTKRTQATINKPVILENVWFETNKTILLKGSSIALDKLVSQMQANKTMKVEVRGHTDNTGDEVKNQKLSEDRAKAIVDYLVLKKIDRTQLSYKGFGSKQPLASNDTEEGKKKNRRVEFVVIK